MAQIIVEDSGQNSIVIVSGANDFLTPGDVEAARDTLSKAKILLSVLEIPRQTVLAGLKLASQLGGDDVLILNTQFIPSTNSLQCLPSSTPHRP